MTYDPLDYVGAGKAIAGIGNKIGDDLSTYFQQNAAWNEKKAQHDSDISYKKTLLNNTLGMAKDLNLALDPGDTDALHKLANDENISPEDMVTAAGQIIQRKKEAAYRGAQQPGQPAAEQPPAQTPPPAAPAPSPQMGPPKDLMIPQAPQSGQVFLQGSPEEQRFNQMKADTTSEMLNTRPYGEAGNYPEPPPAVDPMPAPVVKPKDQIIADNHDTLGGEYQEMLKDAKTRYDTGIISSTKYGEEKHDILDKMATLTKEMKKQQNDLAEKKTTGMYNHLVDYLKSGKGYLQHAVTGSKEIDPADLSDHPEMYRMVDFPTTGAPKPPGGGWSGGRNAPLSMENKNDYAEQILSGKLDLITDLPRVIARYGSGAQDIADINHIVKSKMPEFDPIDRERAAKAYSMSIKPMNATQTFYSNLDNIDKAIDALPPAANINALNEVLRKGQYQLNNIPVVDFETLTHAVASELGNSLGAGQSAVSRDDAAKKIMNSGGNIAALKAVFKQVRSIETNRLVTLAMSGGVYGENHLKDMFGDETANALIAQEKSRLGRTGAKAAADGGGVHPSQQAAGETMVVKGVTYQKGTDGKWHKQQ